MRTPRTFPARLTLAALALLGAASPAHAQGTNTPYNVSWAALDPGNDWAAQVIRSIFPIPGGTPGSTIGAESTVIQQLVGQFTGFVGAIACAFVAYTVIMNIHRAAESSRILGTGQSWMFVVRVGFAAIMMFPLGGGFSAGQAMVMQGAMVGVGMAKAVYANAIKAVGPDAIVIAQPMIPGTKQIVAGLIDSELCMDLVNLASNTGSNNGGPLVPIPGGMNGPEPAGGGYTTWRYQLSVNNGWGNPACGTVTIRTPNTNQQTIGGVTIDMAAVQGAILNDVVVGAIRNPVAQVAQALWKTKKASALTPLQTIFTSANSTYTSELTSAATSVQSAINSSVQTNTQQNRAGANDLATTGQAQQSALGWTGAGAYYLKIAELNGATLSLLQDIPVVTAPTYQGLGRAMSIDLAPLAAAQKDFMKTLDTIVQTTDTSNVACGVPATMADGKDTSEGTTVLTKTFCSLHLSNFALKSIANTLMPADQVWTDPFGGLIKLGQMLINTALVAMGAAALLSSTVTSAGSAVFEFLTGNWGAAAATVAGHAIMEFLGTPILLGLLAILLPGITIAYVLPMIPWVMWMAGVMGWIILVCEAMIAVPLWMLAHMTFGGDGLHGRATEGWALLFNVVFRPTLMILGLFMGYFVFDCMSWLIRTTFGIAAGFVLANGWIVSNFIGLATLLTIFVMMQVTAATVSFRMVALLPHHLPRLIGFSSAGRVDTEDFASRAALNPGNSAARLSAEGVTEGAGRLGAGQKQLPRSDVRRISNSQPAGGEGTSEGMDSSLRAATDHSPGGGEEA